MAKLSLYTLYQLMVLAQEEVEAAKNNINVARETLNKAKATYQKRLDGVRAELVHFKPDTLPQWARNVRDGADWNFSRGGYHGSDGEDAASGSSVSSNSSG